MYHACEVIQLFMATYSFRIAMLFFLDSTFHKVSNELNIFFI